MCVHTYLVFGAAIGPKSVPCMSKPLSRWSKRRASPGRGHECESRCSGASSLSRLSVPSRSVLVVSRLNSTARRGQWRTDAKALSRRNLGCGKRIPQRSALSNDGSRMQLAGRSCVHRDRNTHLGTIGVWCLPAGNPLFPAPGSLLIGSHPPNRSSSSLLLLLFTTTQHSVHRPSNYSSLIPLHSFSGHSFRSIT